MTPITGLRTEPWPNDRERQRMAVERLIGPLKVVWVLSVVGLLVGGPVWLLVPIVLAYPIIGACNRFATGSDGVAGWAVEKASRGGTIETFELRLPNNKEMRRALPNYIQAASNRGYVADGPSSMSLRKIVTTFVRRHDTPDAPG